MVIRILRLANRNVFSNCRSKEAFLIFLFHISVNGAINLFISFAPIVYLPASGLGSILVLLFIFPTVSPKYPCEQNFLFPNLYFILVYHSNIFNADLLFTVNSEFEYLSDISVSIRNICHISFLNLLYIAILRYDYDMIFTLIT